MRALPLAAAFLLVGALAGPALAQTCTSSTPEWEANGFYVDVDCSAPLAQLCATCSVPATWSTGWCSPWIYQESNDIPGLQRGDEVVDDTDGGLCHPSDTILF